jgi:hypothetical protein
MPDGIVPRLAFPGADSAWAGVHAVAVAVAVVLIWRLLWWERQLASRSVGWTLLGLRLACLAVVLLTLFQPTWAWVIDRRETGRMVVAVDVSESMWTTDPHATPREQVGWAVALGWLDRGVQRPAGDDEPLGPRQTPPGVDPRIWTDIAQRLHTTTRAEIARQALVEGRRPLLRELEDLGDVDLVWFGGVAQPLSPGRLQRPLEQPPVDALPDSTRIETALRSALATAAGGRVLGVVLFTDGRDNASTETVAAARQLAESSVPIYPVLLGSTRRPKDLAVVSVDAPQSVYQGDRPRVRVLVTTSGFAGTPVDVTLDRAEPRPGFAPLTQTITGADAPQVVEFELSADDLGRQEYVATIAALPEETRPDNNSRPFTIQVVDDRTRVLVVDGEPRWEFRYLEAALSRDERVNLDVVLFQQPYLALLPQPFFPNDWPVSDDPQVTSPFADRDLVVLGDVSAREFSDQEWQALDEFVADQGGTLVLIAGKSSMPLGLTDPTLRKLLPITQPRPATFPTPSGVPPMLRGWTWSLTAEGERQTGLQFATTEEANRTIWNVLPGATWAIVGEPKPAATVWAWGRAANDAAPQTPSVPLIVHQYYGLGQVVWLASDSTWRWRFRVGDQFHHRFWGQLARWAATAKLSAGNQFVQFGPLKTQYALSEDVELQARWAARGEQTAEPKSAVAELRRGEQVLSRVPLAPDPKRPRISLGKAGRLPPGDYVARLVINEGEGEPLDAPFTVIAPPSSELADVAANRELLQQLADLTGGKLYEPADLADLPREFRPFESVTTLPQEQPLWDRWPTFLLLIGLMAVEWVVRRVNGLP